MKDISDEELRNIERTISTPSVNTKREDEDRDLISMVQNIKDGKSIVREPVNEPIEPEVAPPVNANVAQTVKASFVPGQASNANYWKIDGLPSKGKFYPEGSEILGRPMKVLEVKKISSMGEENGDFVINDIVRRCVTGIDTNDLYVADKLYIIFWLRANTYRDSGYIIPFMCPKCEKKSEYHFEVDNLEVKFIEDDFSPNKEITMLNGDKVSFDYLKIKDEIFIDRFKELNSQMVGEIDDELLAMSQMIKSINGKQPTLLQKYNWIIGVEPGDYSYLKTYMEKKGMGMKPFVNIECKECGGTAPVGVSFREEFLIPEYKFD